MGSGLDVGSVFSKLVLDISDFNNKLNQARTKMAEVTTAIEKHTGGFGNAFSKIGGVVGNVATSIKGYIGSAISQAGEIWDATMAKMKYAAVALTVAVGYIGKQAINAANEFEQATVAYTTLFKDRAKAVSVLKDIENDAKMTPFNLIDLIKANQALISAGESADNSRNIVKNLGDAISATGGGQEEFNRMIFNLQQIKNLGQASAMDIRQFGMAGINIYGMLAETTGKNVEELKNMDISYEMLTQAFAKASSEGGRFHNAMVDQSKTWQGLKSNLQDVISITLKNIITQSGLYDVMKGWILALTNFITENGPVFIAWLQRMVEAVKNSVWIDLMASAFRKLGQWISDNKDMILTFLKGLAFAIGVVTVAVMGMKVYAGVMALFAILTSPLFWVIAALTLLYVAWDKNFLGIKDITRSVFNFVKSHLDDIKAYFVFWVSFLKAIIQGDFKKAWDIFKGYVGPIFDDIKDVIKTKLSDWKNEILQWFSDRKNDIKMKLEEWKLEVANFFTNLPTTIMNGLTLAKDVMINYLTETTTRWGEYWLSLGDSMSLWLSTLPERFTTGMVLLEASIMAWFYATKASILFQLADWWDGISLWFDSLPEGFTAKLNAVWNSMLLWFETTKTNVINWFTNLGKDMPDSMVKGYEQNKETMAGKIVKHILLFIGLILATLVVGLIDVGIQAVNALISGIERMISKLFTMARNWGTSFMSNFAEGIRNGIRWVENAVDNVIKKAKEKLGFSYNEYLPSEVWGKHFIQNFAEGMKNGMGALDGQLNNVLGSASGLQFAGANSETNYNQTINATINNGIDLEMLKNEMGSILRQQY